MFQHKSVYDPQEPSDGLRMLVMRYWPRGVKRSAVDLWMRNLAPSQESLRRYREGAWGWEAFAQSYRQEVAAKEEQLKELCRLDRQHGTITLLCWEREEPHPSSEGLRCHRIILCELLAAGSPGRRAAEGNEDTGD